MKSANLEAKCQEQTVFGTLASEGISNPISSGAAQQNCWGQCLNCGQWHAVGDCRKPPSVQKAPSTGRDHLAEPKTAYEGGATRTEKAERYDLVPPEAIDAIARRMGLGVPKHGENNWRGGGVAFIKATINHLYAHLSALLKGDATDNHLDAVTCNSAFLCWFKANKPHDYETALRSLRGLPVQLSKLVLNL